MNFDQSFTALIGNEGGYTTNPKDKGNWTGGVVGKGLLLGTKYGIAASQYPSVDIKNLSLDDAKAIYKRDYWDKCHTDELPEPVRFDMFDMAVNSGIGNAAMALQAAVGATVDGHIGVGTIAAMNTLDPQVVDKRFAAQRLLFLCSIKSWPDFGKGWVIRVANNLMKD